MKKIQNEVMTFNQLILIHKCKLNKMALVVLSAGFYSEYLTLSLPIVKIILIAIGSKVTRIYRRFSNF